MSGHDWQRVGDADLWRCTKCGALSRDPWGVIISCEHIAAKRRHSDRQKGQPRPRAKPLREGLHGENILAQVDWWYRNLIGSPCPQSHLKRTLALDGGHLRRLLDQLVDAGILQFVDSPYAGEPDVRRTPAAQGAAQRYRYKGARS